MSVDNTGADIPAIQGTEQQQQETGGNPAWQELYDVMPSNLHPQIKPVLEKWEQGTQQKFQEYSERDKRYEPYKDFIENDIPADRIAEALQLAQLIDTDPRGLLEQMQAFFGEDNSQQQQQQPQGQDDPNFEPSFEDQPFDLESDPRFQQLAQQQDIIANFLAQQTQAELAQEADSALEAELNSLKESAGEFDERYVLTLAASGMELADAVKQYQELVEGIRSRPAPDANMPTVIGGGGVPAETPDMGNLTANDRKSLVMNILKQASEQG